MLFFLLLAWATAAHGLTAGAATFAVFGNSATKSLIKNWSPKPVGVASGSVMLPSSTENMQRFVRARILLEDPAVGCVASTGGDNKINLILFRFTGAEHQVLLPLWQPNAEADASSTFRNLAGWHKERLSHKLLSGAHICYPGDRAAWVEADHQP